MPTQIDSGRLKGLFNITVTPFDAEGKIDIAAFAAIIERSLELGFDGLLIGGTYGEFATMTVEERATLFRKAKSVAAGRKPLLLCTAHSDPAIVRELTKLADDLEEIPMVMPPYVSEVIDDHIFAFFQDIVKVSKSVMIYNAPGVGITLSPRLIERIADIEGIVALKQGELAPTIVDELVGRVGGRIRLFCASDLQMLGPIVAGFDGVSSTNSCALPELIQSVYRAVSTGDAVKGGALQASWYKYRSFARAAGQPQTVKAAMDLRGWKGGHVRRPLLDLPAARREELAAIIDSMKL